MQSHAYELWQPSWQLHSLPTLHSVLPVLAYPCYRLPMHAQHCEQPVILQCLTDVALPFVEATAML